MVKELNCSKFQIHQPVRVTAAGKWQGYRGTVRSTHNGIVDVDFGERSPKSPRGKRLTVSFSERELEASAMPPPAFPTVRHISREYREFYIFTRTPLKGGIAVHASNETWKIRLEQYYYNIEPNEAWERMRQTVDNLIAECELPIAEYKAPKYESWTAADASRYLQQIQLKERATRKAMVKNNRQSFPAAKGIMAGREIYVAWVPIPIATELFDIDWTDLPPEERAQRVPSPTRIKRVRDYVVEHPSDYFFPALTASIDGKFDFEASDINPNSGVLHVEPGTKLVLIDGGHRHGGCTKALSQLRQLRNESLAFVLMPDRGLRHNQQVFATVNLTARKVPPSLGLQYDCSDREANFNRNVVDRVPLLSQYTDRENNSVSGKNNKLFCLTWFHKAHKLMRPGRGYEADLKFCSTFWESLTQIIPEWREFYDGKRTAQELHQDYICTHAIAISALAEVGRMMSNNTNFCDNPEEIPKFLTPLAQINWSKRNPDWKGRILEQITTDKIKVLTRPENKQLFAIYLKQLLKIPLNNEEKALENQFSSREKQNSSNSNGKNPQAKKPDTKEKAITK